MSATTSKAVREALAAAGYGRKDVSVRNDSYSMGSTVHVQIRRADIALDAVDRIASAHERVSRDSATGEILSGGNTFIDVKYASGTLDAATAVIREHLEIGAYLFGTLELFDDRQDPDRVDVRTSGVGGAHVAMFYREYAAEHLTRLLAARGELAAVLAELAQGRAQGQANDVAPVAAPAAPAAPVVALEAPAELAAAPVLAEAPAAPVAPVAASPSPSALILARKLLIAAQLEDIAAQLSSVAGDSWDLAGDLARVIRTLDEMPVFGRHG